MGRAFVSCVCVVFGSLLVGWFASPCAADSGPVTFESLVREMVDRDRLVEWPDPEYVCRQASSYDRASKTPNPEDGTFRPEKGRDWGKGWFANHDFANFLRTEEIDGRTEHVMLDQSGPGALVRMWHALGGKAWRPGGIVRVYLDESPKPVIQMYVRDLVGGRGLVGEPFSYLASDDNTNLSWRGRNLYLPIPYARHCKVTWDDSPGADVNGWMGFYYQINYRQYAPGTEVVSFRRDQLVEAKTLLAEVAEQLRTSGAEYEVKECKTISQLTVQPGEAAEAVFHGSSCIKQLALALSADDVEQALRSTVLEIRFDGQTTVWCPVGAFFGVGYSPVPHQTFYTARARGGRMTSRWTMPFRDKAVVTLHNHGQQPVSISDLQIESAPYTWTPRSMYFHACWHELRHADTNIRRDINFVTVQGQGIYVGDSLTLFNTHPDWWGEGDEKIFVDGEDFPSHIGTGTEDYYGYAWCRPQTFSRPWHSQPIGAGNKAVGVTTNNRVRSLDAIPFRRSLAFYMELWHPFRARVNYAPAAFWYARPDATANVEPSWEAVREPVAKSKADVLGP